LENKAVLGIFLLLLLASMLLSTFIIHSVSVSGAIPAITILYPQSKIYTVNASIPLTFTIDEVADWIGYSLNGQPNETITENTTLPILSDGWHSVVVYANDSFNSMEASAVRLFTVDTIAPTGSITINDGALSTTSTQVTLSLSAEDDTSGVAQMRFFDFAYTDWEEYVASKYWNFKAGEGYKFIYVQFRDNAGLVSAPYRANIVLGTSTTLDSSAPHAPMPETPNEMPEEPPKNNEKYDDVKPPEEEKPEVTASAPPSKSIPDLYSTPEVAGLIVIILVVSATTVLLLRKR